MVCTAGAPHPVLHLPPQRRKAPPDRCRWVFTPPSSSSFFRSSRLAAALGGQIWGRRTRADIGAGGVGPARLDLGKPGKTGAVERESIDETGGEPYLGRSDRWCSPDAPDEERALVDDRQMVCCRRAARRAGQQGFGAGRIGADRCCLVDRARSGRAEADSDLERTDEETNNGLGWSRALIVVAIRTVCYRRCCCKQPTNQGLNRGRRVGFVAGDDAGGRAGRRRSPNERAGEDGQQCCSWTGGNGGRTWIWADDLLL